MDSKKPSPRSSLSSPLRSLTPPQREASSPSPVSVAVVHLLPGPAAGDWRPAILQHPLCLCLYFSWSFFSPKRRSAVSFPLCFILYSRCLASLTALVTLRHCACPCSSQLFTSTKAHLHHQPCHGALRKALTSTLPSGHVKMLPIGSEVSAVDESSR